MKRTSHTDDLVLTAPDRCTRYRAPAVAPAVDPTPPRPRHLLGVWAHPDDEAYLSAALMARTVEEGGRVTLVTLTDGEAGFPEDDPRPARERARQRRGELTAAMARIGVTDVRFLGLPDGGVTDHGGEDLVATIGRLMYETRPDVTVTFGPDGITGHEDHVANSWAVTRAWRDVGSGELWYAAKSTTWLDEWRHVHDEIGIWMAGEPDGMDPDDAVFVLDLDGADLDRKRAVLAEHRSQTTAVAAVFGEDDYRSWIGQESFRLPTRAELDAAASSGHRVLSGSVL